MDDVAEFLNATESIARRYTVDPNQNLYHLDVPMPSDELDACVLENVYWLDVRFTKRVLRWRTKYDERGAARFQSQRNSRDSIAGFPGQSLDQAGIGMP